MKTTKKLITLLIACTLFGAQVMAVMAANEPSNVTGVKATAVDSSSVKVTWNAAKDSAGKAVSKYRIYYGTTSVFKAQKGTYDSNVDTKDNTTSYTVTGLKANTTYYFAVIAIDSNGVGSSTYSLEASAKTKATSSTTTDDKKSPTVANVTAPDKTHVNVTFSESVKLPATSPQAAFSIKEQVSTSKTLKVKSAKVSTTDSKTVVLETAEQTAKTNYVLTVGIAVKDLQGNPIVSGSTDSGLFIGSDKTASANTGSSSATDCVQSMTCFTTAIATCAKKSVDQVSSDSKYKYKLEITGADTTGQNCVVKYTAKTHPNPLYANTSMSCNIAKANYASEKAFAAAFDIKNCKGALVTGYKAIAVSSTNTTDTTPPENVTNLKLLYKAKLKKFIVTLSWTASVNTAKDLVDQLLYMSLDRGKTYGKAKSLGASTTKTDVTNLDGGKEYTFKITTKDKAGNESTGAIRSIRLPKTGMGIGLILAGSLYGASRIMRRRRK